MQPSVAKYCLKLLQFAGEKSEGIRQVKFALADMLGTLKVMLKWPVKNKYVLDFKTENNVIEFLVALVSYEAVYKCDEELGPGCAVSH